METKLQYQAYRLFRLLGLSYSVHDLFDRVYDQSKVLNRLHVARERAFDRMQRRKKANV